MSQHNEQSKQESHSERGHDLYKTGDPDAPDCIKDDNGDVALGLCRKCGRGEIELEEPCIYVKSIGPLSLVMNLGTNQAGPGADASIRGLQEVASKITSLPRRHDNDYPLWQGPCAPGPLGGITQSMIVRFLSCRERFRLKYVLGLEPHDKWNKNLGYGNMWHLCEEHFAKDQRGLCGEWQSKLIGYAADQAKKYRIQEEEVAKWCRVCLVQFPEYIKYWQDHPDVLNRTPLMQEQVFDVPYTLPSGRIVRLRGKFDSVDLISDVMDDRGDGAGYSCTPSGIYLQENKSKGDIDKLQVERQLKFDLQTMLYSVALLHDLEDHNEWDHIQFKGVRYNVVRRPLSGGIGNIKPHAAKYTKTKTTPAETADQFYERLRRDYIAKDPAYWFFRVRAEISAKDIQVFRETCLDPLLETVCDWYDHLTQPVLHVPIMSASLYYRTPFGVYSALEEGGATEYDAYLETGSEAGLRRVETLFPELQ